MPLNVRSFSTTALLVLAIFSAVISAQTPPPEQPAAVRPPTSAEVMGERLSKAKAFIAVRNYSAAIFELESIRRETSDTSVNAVANVLLMNSYLEQGEYKRAQDFLAEFFKSYKSNSAAGNLYYNAVAAQVVKGARSKVERYSNLGLTVSDRNLPLQAVNDIEQMRETLELVVEQAKELGKDKAKSGVAMALLEEATNSRSILARDEYDARRWRDELGDSREQIASSRSVIINAVDGTAEQSSVRQETVAMVATSSQVPANNTPAVATPVSNMTTAAGGPKQTVETPVFKPVPANSKPSDTTVASVAKPTAEQPKPADSQPSRIVVGQPAPKTEAKKEPQATQQVPAPTPTPVQNAGPLEVGSLIAFATKQTPPSYPPAARSMRTTGVVKVEVTVNEQGDVEAVENAEGPSMLQTAAKDAIRKWKFKPFVRDGQPVKAVGFVNFNFSL